MQPSFQELLDRINRLSAQFQEIHEGIQKAIRLVDEDPEMALTRVRKVLEYVVRDVFERRIKEPPGTRPLENLQERIRKDGFFPDRLDAYATAIRKLGNVGAHKYEESVTSADAYNSLNHIVMILEWYFEEERPDAPPREQKQLIKSPHDGGSPGPAPLVVWKGLSDLAALLRTPEVWDKVVTFKEVFRTACTQIALVSEFKMLHDKLQDLQIGYRTIALLRRGAGSGEPDWDNLDVEGQNLLWLLDDLVKAARGVSSAAKESLWIVKLESAGKLFSQVVADRDKDKLNSACTIIDETVVKRLFEFNRRLIDAVRVLNLPSLVGRLSEIREKLDAMSLDETASERRAGFIKDLDALAEMSERWEAQVARHDVFQNIEDELTSAHGAIREDFDIFLIFWAPVCEVIRGAGGDAWPKLLRGAADAVSVAAGDRNPSKTAMLFQKFRDQLSLLFKKANTDLLQMCRQFESLGKELAMLLEMTSHG